MTLKTLKDLKQTEWNIEVTPEEYFVNYDETRQEAIKRFKDRESKQQCIGDDDWKDFFNITEKDMEDKNE